MHSSVRQSSAPVNSSVRHSQSQTIIDILRFDAKQNWERGRPSALAFLQHPSLNNKSLPPTLSANINTSQMLNISSTNVEPQPSLMCAARQHMFSTASASGLDVNQRFARADVLPPLPSVIFRPSEDTDSVTEQQQLNIDGANTNTNRGRSGCRIHGMSFKSELKDAGGLNC